MTSNVRVLSKTTKDAGDASQILYPELGPKARGVEIIAPGAILYPKNPPPKFPDIIAPASMEQENARKAITPPPPEKPVLPRPELCSSSHLVRAMIAARVQNDRLIREIMDGVNERLNVECMHYREFETKLADVLDDLQKQGETTESWSVFNQVVSFVTTSASILVGTSLALTTGAGAVGVGLIIAGTAGIGNHVMEVSGGWDKLSSYLTDDEQTQKTIARGFSTGGDVMVALSTLGTGYAALSSVQAGTAMATLSRFISTSGSIVQGTASVGKGLSEIEQTKKSVKALDANKESRRTKTALTRGAKMVQAQSELHQKTVEAATKTLRAHIQKQRIAASAA